MFSTFREGRIMKASDVFTPAGVPTVTYIERDGQKLARALRDSIRTPGLITSLSGPSKSGKTTLIKTVIAVDKLIAISGAAIVSGEHLWERVLNQMNVPSSSSLDSGQIVGADASAKAGGSIKVPFVASGTAEVSGGGKFERSLGATQAFSRTGIDQVIDNIGGSDFVVFIDDYHYMTPVVQTDVARQIKEAAEKGVKICTASVPHRADDIVRSNVELRGRVKAIDFEYWSIEELAEIGDLGFKALNISIDREILMEMAVEAFGSPQLMQQMCLQTCYYFEKYENVGSPVIIHINRRDLENIFENTATTTDFSSLVDAMHSGAKTRGAQRAVFSFTDGSIGDVYRCILLAIQCDPPKLIFGYDEIYVRTRSVCVIEAPSGSSVTQALEQIDGISKTIQPSAPCVEWSEDVLDIVDPYFLFYIRGSKRLSKLRK